jgi:glutamyl/glutaminyl-tRNA synthetase
VPLGRPFDSVFVCLACLFGCLKGYLPDAMINYLALLGWNDGTDKDIYTRQELIDSFDLNRVTASPAQFDQVRVCGRVYGCVRSVYNSIACVRANKCARTSNQAQVLKHK